MINGELTEELAGLLDLERQEAVSLFNGFCGAMVAELLAFRKLSVKGLGSFYVTHVPASKKNAGSAMVFAPPVNKLRFECDISNGDETASLAVSRLSMSQTEAVRFAKTLAKLFSAALQQEKEVTLNGLGRFALEDGAYSFFPDRTMEELLNREYQDLKEVVLPQREPVKRERRVPGYFLPLSVLILVGILFAVLYPSFSVSIFSPSTVDPSKSVATPVDRSLAPVALPQPVPTVHQIKLSGGVTDSLVLVQGDYAIVLATFESEKSALKEQFPLHAAGINAFVWPAFMDEVRYFRLMTGKFPNREAAAEHLRGMPKKIGSSAYIQRVKKGVVLYGKKGL